jgi:hypothetical protein
MKSITKFVAAIAPVMLVALAAGCSQDAAPSGHTEADFKPNDGSRAVWQAVDRQVALGAREGATLQPMDFDGNQLNGLGMSHLDTMMREKPAPAIVYVNVPERDSMTGARVDAVTKYLAQMSTGENPIDTHGMHVMVGANWASHSEAGEGLSRIVKTENPTLKSTDFSTSATDAPSMSGGTSK